MKCIWIAAGLPLAVLATQGFAQDGPIVRDNDFSYDYIQIGYENYDWDDAFEDANIIRGDIQYSLDEQILLRGGIDAVDGDGKADGVEVSVGVGYTVPLQNRLDGVITGDIVHVNVDVGDDETGFRAIGKVRHRTTDRVELAGGAFVEDVFDTEVGVLGQALLNLTRQFDVGAEVKFGGDLTTVGVFGRYNY